MISVNNSVIYIYNLIHDLYRYHNSIKLSLIIDFVICDIIKYLCEREKKIVYTS